MLSDIVNDTLKRYLKWRIPATERDDIRQEAWLAALEAEASGINDESVITRFVETRLVSFFRKQQRIYDTEYRVSDEELDDPTDIQQRLSSHNSSRRRQIEVEVAGLDGSKEKQIFITDHKPDETGE
jgi:hypothetical protein